MLFLIARVNITKVLPFIEKEKYLRDRWRTRTMDSISYTQLVTIFSTFIEDMDLLEDNTIWNKIISPFYSWETEYLNQLDIIELKYE